MLRRWQEGWGPWVVLKHGRLLIEVRIYVVEALLITIYLPEKDVYIHNQPALLLEATSFSWGLPS